MTDGRARLLIASGNPGKLREFQRLLAAGGWDLVTPTEAGIGGLAVAEDANTYRGNAARKARAYANAARLPALADDSGLEVDALDGAPGVRSARYAGERASNADNRRKLLDALAEVPPRQRMARFRCVVALALPYGPDVRMGEGIVEGRIARDERGGGGFGYDPVFELADGRRMAELAEDEKNQISHRAHALRDLRGALDALRETVERHERGGAANGNA